jgi:hypothetical protein
VIAMRAINEMRTLIDVTAMVATMATRNRSSSHTGAQASVSEWETSMFAPMSVVGSRMGS